MITPRPPHLRALSHDGLSVLGSDPSRWGSFGNNSRLSCLMNSSPTAHLNWAYGLHGFPSHPSCRSIGSYETYFSSPPRSKARFTIWPQKHNSPAKPGSLIEKTILVLSAWPNTNYNTKYRAMLLMGNDKQWIRGRKIMGFNHIKISQAHSSFQQAANLRWGHNVLMTLTTYNL